MTDMPELRLHNTLSGTKELFVPLDPSHIRVYACGPTVYDRVHIGNARPIVVFDVLVLLLRHLYPRVTYVRNITDVDDKIINRARDKNIGIGLVRHWPGLAWPPCHAWPGLTKPGQVRSGLASLGLA